MTKRKEVISFRGNKKLWDKWVLGLRKKKIKIWNRLEPFIRKDFKKLK